jgi:tetratricopeptide (TPR) repeat protein
VVVGACAPRPGADLGVSAPKFPESVQPVVPPALANPGAAANQDRGWSFLQAGDLKSAEREFGAALVISGAFYPAEAALGYVALARKDARAALPHFDRALEQQRDYVAALVGRGETLLALNREPDALEAFEAAVAADPSLTDLQRRVEVFRFRELQQNLAGAREAVRSGQMTVANERTARSRLRRTVRFCIASSGQPSDREVTSTARSNISARPSRSIPLTSPRWCKSETFSTRAAISTARPKPTATRWPSSGAPPSRRSSSR